MLQIFDRPRLFTTRTTTGLPISNYVAACGETSQDHCVGAYHCLLRSDTTAFLVFFASYNRSSALASKFL